jgi:enamine deaminase RidA (YjgF/YER057c/UK114 family)
MSELIALPAAGPYSPGLLTGDSIFLSGQGGGQNAGGSDSIRPQATRGRGRATPAGR